MSLDSQILIAAALLGAVIGILIGTVTKPNIGVIAAISLIVVSYCIYCLYMCFRQKN